MHHSLNLVIDEYFSGRKRTNEILRLFVRTRPTHDNLHYNVIVKSRRHRLNKKV